MIRSPLCSNNYRYVVPTGRVVVPTGRLMFGDAALGALNIEMVEVARRVGAASKFTGSGGAVVAFCPDGTSQVELLEDACKKSGFSIVPVKVVSSLLNEIDIRTLINNQTP
ncbi:glucuronokinase 1, partial [Tanacetum coccineum]